MAKKMTPAEKAYAAAVRHIAQERKKGATTLSFDSDAYRALDRIPPELRDFPGLQALYLSRTAITDLAPLQGMTGLQSLSLSNTAITDLAPLQGMTGLQALYLSQTAVTDFALLQGMTGLRTLYLDRTAIADLAPLQGMIGLQSLSLSKTSIVDFDLLQDMTNMETLFLYESAIADLAPLQRMTKLNDLYLNQTATTDIAALQGMTGLRALWLQESKVRDLRPIMAMSKLGQSFSSGLYFSDTPATERDPKLHALSLIEDNEERTRETIAYLKTLPPWPEPLPGDEPPAQPAPDPAVPLQHDDGVIALASTQITAAERDDPIRETLHTVLQDQVSDLIRVSGNLDEAAYTQACKLRDLLEVGLLLMNPLLVHLALEALRRIRAKTRAEADRDFLLALEAVIETGPGLTLDTREVQLFVDRAQRNRIERLAEAQAEAQIRLAQSIADSGLSAADLQGIARRAADESVYDQFTAIRPTLARNYTLEVGKWALVAIASGPMGEAGTLAVQWLAANAADIRSMASVWGEPFAVWIAPILEKAQQVVDGAKHLLKKHRKP